MVDTEAVQANTPQPSRLPGLDLLRALAIVFVLLRHGPTPGEGELPALLHAFFEALKRGGWIGVDLFFVLSGFLVSGLLMREHRKFGTINARRFLIRRGWKIYPPLIAFTVVVMLVYRKLLWAWPIDGFINQTLFVQNYFPGLQDHTWSLAVEEHAYLLIAAVFGGLFALAKRRQRDFSLRWLPWAFGAIAVAGLLLRLRIAGQPFDPYTHLFPTHLRIDSLFAGVTLAYFYQYHPAATTSLIQRLRAPMLVLGLGLLLPPFIWKLETHPAIHTWGLITNYLGSALLICAALHTQPRQGRAFNLCLAVGRHSYSIYLWHILAWSLLAYAVNGTYAVQGTIDLPFILNLPLYVLFTIAVGVVLSLCIEAPSLYLRDRLYPSKTGSLSDNPALTDPPTTLWQGTDQADVATTKSVVPATSRG